MARQAGAEAPLVQPGQLLGGRYLLHRMHAARARSQLWQATDQVLARPVAVRLVPVARQGGGTLPTEAAVRAAAARAGAVSTRRLVRILDCDAAEPAGHRFCYVVTEWVDAPVLSTVLRDEPLAPAEATDVAWQVADTLAQAARHGLGHGGLHPGNVALTPTGEVRVMDLELARVLAGPAGRPEPDARWTQDVRAVGALLYAALTGYWPGRPGWGLPEAPLVAGQRATPRQVRAAVPRELDELTEHLLRADGVAGAAAAAGLLAALPRERRDLERPAADPARDRPAPRWLLPVVPVLALVAIAIAAYLVGGVVGQVPAPAQSLPAFTSPGSGPGGARLAPIRVAAVSVFNPQGHDPEDVSGAPLAVDGKANTAWYTFRYYGNPVFGGLKSGVGLLLDLGRPRTVRAVHVTLVYPGAGLQLYAAPADYPSLSGYRMVASAPGAGRSAYLDPSRPVTARYWLVWLTRLPQVGSYYNEGLAEVALYG